MQGDDLSLGLRRHRHGPAGLGHKNIDAHQSAALPLRQARPVPLLQIDAPVRELVDLVDGGPDDFPHHVGRLHYLFDAEIDTQILQTDSKDAVPVLLPAQPSLRVLASSLA